MAVSIGTYSKIAVFEHFLSFISATMGTTRVAVGGNGVNYTCVNEGSFAVTEDEEGGVLAVTNDTADNDNCFLCIGPFKPANGGVWMEARFKMASLIHSFYAGFAETLDATTPVMPAEYATATLTCNGTGGMAGFLYDYDATTGRWLAVAGNAGAAASGAPAEVNNGQAPVADEYDTVRVEIQADGSADLWIAAKDGGLNFIKRFKECVTPTDLVFAVIGDENRSGAAAVWEVDYFNAGSHIDWTR